GHVEKIFPCEVVFASERDHHILTPAKLRIVTGQEGGQVFQGLLRCREGLYCLSPLLGTLRTEHLGYCWAIAFPPDRIGEVERLSFFEILLDVLDKTAVLILAADSHNIYPFNRADRPRRGQGKCFATGLAAWPTGLQPRRPSLAVILLHPMTFQCDHNAANG